jgi:hypothetical protein
VDTEFGNLWLSFAQSKAAAAEMLARSKEEDRPILHAVSALGLDLELQSNLHLAQRVAASRDISRNGGITPKIDGEREIGVAPAAETEPR